MPTICPSCGSRNLEGADQCANCGADLRAVDLPRPAARIERSVMEQPLTALGVSKIHAVAPDTTIEAAIQTLLRQKLDILGVVEGEKLIGLLSVRDIFMRVGTGYPVKLNSPVRDYMTPDPETLPTDAPITFAINRMDVGGYRHVPVVEDGRLIGVVSARDLIHYLFAHSRETAAVVGKTTSHGVQDPAATSGA